MNITTRSAGAVSILDLNGRIALGESSVALRDKIRQLASSGQNHILLNMGEVSRMDSSGVGELVNAYAHVTSHGGELKLLNLTKTLRELLTITKLLTVFDCFDDEAKAVQSFKK